MITSTVCCQPSTALSRQDRSQGQLSCILYFLMEQPVVLIKVNLAVLTCTDKS